MSEKNGGCCVIDFYFIFGINNLRRSQVYFLFSFYFRRSSAFNEISLELEKGKKTQNHTENRKEENDDDFEEKQNNNSSKVENRESV